MIKNKFDQKSKGDFGVDANLTLEFLRYLAPLRVFNKTPLGDQENLYLKLYQSKNYDFSTKIGFKIKNCDFVIEFFILIFITISRPKTQKTCM